MLLKELFLIELTYEEIPKANYGYWIDNKGQLIPVGPGNHIRVAAKLLRGALSAIYQDSSIIIDAFEKGWVRLVFSLREPDEIQIEFTLHISPNAKQQLVNLLKLFRKELAYIWVDVKPRNETFTGPNAAGKAINWINQQ